MLPSTPKILHVLLSMAMGGAETLVYNMVRHSSFAGNKPVECCLKSVGDLGEKLKEYMLYISGEQAQSGT